MLDHLHISLHALQLLQTPMQRLEILKERRLAVRLPERRHEFVRQERELVRERMPEKGQLLRGVEVFGCFGASGFYGSVE